MEDRSAWRRADLGSARSWVREVPTWFVDELEQGADRAEAAGLSPWELTREMFELPRGDQFLADVLDELERGRGFAVLGSLPVDRWDLDRAILIYAGIGIRFGRITEQTSVGDRIIEVIDRERPYDHTSRGYHSNKLLPFHTDGADYAGLLCLGMAAEGGHSVLASAPMVHDIIEAEHPEAAALLKRGFHHHRRGEQAPAEPPISAERIPVFSMHGGLLHAMYNRNPIDWIVHDGGHLDDDEVEALDVLDAVLARPELQVSMEMRPGDLQLINNFVIFHSRSEYVDTAAHRRHLLRIWLSNPNARRTGPTLLDLYAPAASRSATARGAVGVRP